MLYNLESVSSWLVLNQGFKVYQCCTQCGSKDVRYYKVRTNAHQGFSPKCHDCQKEFPVRMKLKKSALHNEAPLYGDLSIYN